MKQEIQERWGEILAYMKTEYNISDVSYRTWLKDLTCYDVDDNIVTIIIDDNKIGDSNPSLSNRKRRKKARKTKKTVSIR